MHLVHHAQVNGISNFPLRLGNKVKHMDIMVPIGPILADCEGGDQFCGRIKSYGVDAKRICRTCDAPQTECSNPNLACHRVTMLECQLAYQNSDLNHISELYIHNETNAFWKMNLGMILWV